MVSEAKHEWGLSGSRLWCGFSPPPCLGGRGVNLSALRHGAQLMTLFVVVVVILREDLNLKELLVFHWKYVLICFSCLFQG